MLRCVLFISLIGCVPELADECAGDDGCASGRCVAGVCVGETPDPFDGGDARSIDGAGPDAFAQLDFAPQPDIHVDPDGPPPPDADPDAARRTSDVAIPFDVAPTPEPEGGCHFGEQRPCDGQADGCGGFVESCTQAELWGPCLPRAAAPETCDGLDGDCNGEADDLLAFDAHLTLASGAVHASGLAMQVEGDHARLVWGQHGARPGVATRFVAIGEPGPGANVLPVADAPSGVALAAPGGRPVLVWVDDGVVLARRLGPDGGGLGPRVVVDRAGGATEPVCAGHRVVWVRGGAALCESRLRLDADVLTAEPPRCPFEASALSSPALALDGDAGALAWIEDDRARFALPAGDGWGPSLALSAGDVRAHEVAIAPHPAGFAVAWLAVGETSGPVLALVNAEGLLGRWPVPRAAGAHGIAVAAGGDYVVAVWAERADAAQRLYAGFARAEDGPSVRRLRHPSRWARQPRLLAHAEGFVLAWIEDTLEGPAPQLGVGGLACP